MKARQATILIYGIDEFVLARRRWMLESRGYRVMTVTDERALRSLAPNIAPRLLLLCHTLSAEERAAAAEIAVERWPEIKTLDLDADGPQIHSGLLGQLLHSRQGPETLIAAVGRVIGQPPEAAGA